MLYKFSVRIAGRLDVSIIDKRIFYLADLLCFNKKSLLLK
jgi:hypothetical protein